MVSKEESSSDTSSDGDGIFTKETKMNREISVTMAAKEQDQGLKIERWPGNLGLQ